MQHSRHRLLRARSGLLAALLVIALPVAFGPASAMAQGAAGPATESDQAPAQPARWVKKKLFFIYAGIQTTYECQGLTDVMKSILLQLGARKSDLDVREANCTSGFNQPTQFPAVAGSFSVLEPVAADQESSASAEGTVPAHWRPVAVKIDIPGRDQNGQCELLQQVKAKIVPLFPARDVKFDQSGCSPRELLVGRTTLSLEVLMPDRRRFASE
jgi:hypothetical protein